MKQNKKTINKNLKLSVTLGENISMETPVLLGGDFLDNIKKSKKMGYDAVELHVNTPNDIDVENIIRACKKYNMAVSGIATGKSYVLEGLSLISDSKEVRELAVERLKRFIDVAQPLGAYVLIGCMKGNIPDKLQYNIYEKYLVESLREVGEYAETKDVLIIFEPINRYESNYLNTLYAVKELIEKYDIPMTKILADIFHMNIEEADINKALKDCIDLIGYIHFADSNRMYPSAGHIDFKEIINTLNNVGYIGFISMECLPGSDGSVSAEKAHDYIKSLL